jgi:hypothetical protein
MLGCRGRKLAGVDPELFQQSGVLLMVDLVGKLLDRLLYMLVLNPGAPRSSSAAPARWRASRRRARREPDERGNRSPNRFDGPRPRRNFFDVDAPRSLRTSCDRHHDREAEKNAGDALHVAQSSSVRSEPRA